MVKKFLLLLLISAMISACHRSTCPAYSNGSMTGTEGTKEKPHELFPDKMSKKKH
ncbi:MAG: hypothetical protein ACHQD9_08645 [Chitinophagales bacterium]